MTAVNVKIKWLNIILPSFPMCAIIFRKGSMYLLSCLTFSLYAMSSWARGLGPALDEGFIGVFKDGTELPGDGTLPKKLIHTCGYK